jgi:hypothetical protein
MGQTRAPLFLSTRRQSRHFEQNPGGENLLAVAGIPCDESRFARQVLPAPL